MSVTPVTATGVALSKLKAMTAACATFQAELQVATAAAALPYVHVPQVRASADQRDKPFAVIKPALNGSLQTDFIAGGGANWFRLQGTLELALYRDVGEHATDEDALYDFLNFAEQVVEELLAQAAVDDKLSIVGLSAGFGPAESHPSKVAGNQAQRPFLKATYLVDWK